MTTQKPLRVLIVDDQESIRELLQRQLERIGHTIAGKASNGLQAIELTESLHPDVVLMDIEMPKMDGLKATKIIMDKYPKPVVLLTSHEDLETIRLASQTGASAYLLKPPSAEEIERTMIIANARFADLMELRRLNSELKEALENVKVLSGLLPICANCKKIRDDKGYWEAIDAYFMKHSDVQFSHGICPSCVEKYYPQFKPKKQQ